jgi:predicted Fe-Mo cluster-binding NifX family protein
MKVCVTSQGTDPSAAVDSRFGRCPYFLIYDDETGDYAAIDNAVNMDAAGGAGVQSATRVAEQGVDWVVSGHIGPKAMAVLQAAGLKVAVGAKGSVAEAVAALKEGSLEQVHEADRPQHW